MSDNAYRPDLLGARCELCPLGPDHNPNGWNPVPPELYAGNLVAAIGEAPGAEEEIALRPFVGKSGEYWNYLLSTFGIQREQISLLNTLACRPPGNEFKILETKTKKKNKERLAQGLPALLMPTVACAPRLASELEPFPYIFLLGNAPTKSVLGIETGILATRGVQREVNGRKFMPTVHPAFVLRAPHYAMVSFADLRRGLRGFTGELYWPQDRRTYLWGNRSPRQQTPAQELLQWFQAAEAAGCTAFSYDVETDGKEPLRCNLRTVAISYLHPEVECVGWCQTCQGTGVVVPPGLDKEYTKRLSYVWCAACVEVLSGKTAPDSVQHRLLGQHENSPFQICSACWVEGRSTFQHRFKTDVTSVGIPFLDPDGRTFYQTPEEATELCKVLAWAFDRFEWVLHNGGYYDLQVMVRYCGTAPGWRRSNAKDTILLARACNAELPKTLGVWGTIFTDVSSSWKADNEGKKLSVSSRHIMDLLPYNITDSIVTDRMSRPMTELATQRGAFRILPDYLKPPEWDDARPFCMYELDRSAQELCVDMHINGMFIDQERRAQEEADLTAKQDKLRKELRDIAHEHGFPMGGTERKPAPFNPGSGPQVARLLYEVADLLPVAYTDLEEPSVGDDALLQHLCDTGLDPWIRNFILKLRTFRRCSKMLSTYVKPLSEHELKEREEGSWLLPVEDDYEGFFIWEDGRVRASWNAHTPNVGRLSCSGPNLTNVRKHYRGMYCAAPGHILVGCDLDQAHLRIIANAWEIPLFLDGFLEGIDPHGRYATWIYGEDAYASAQGWEGVDGGFSLKKKPEKGSSADKLRNTAKVGIYLFVYIGSADTAYQQFLATEDKKGRLIYLEPDDSGVMPEQLRPAMVELMREELLKREPTFQKKAWPSIKKLHRQQGYLTDYLIGRRSDVATFKGNEEVNFPVLATEASLMRLIEVRVRKYFPRGAWGPGTGVINQCHDSITVEVPIALAEWAKATLLQCFTVKVPGWSVPFTAEADIGWFTDTEGLFPTGHEDLEVLKKDGTSFGSRGKDGIIRGRKFRDSFGNVLKSRWVDT